MKDSELNDVAIVGAGPTGLTALLYASMYRLRAVCIGDEIGGKLNLAPEIIDYPGFESTSGKEFIAHLQAQVYKFQGQIEAREISEIRTVDAHGETQFQLQVGVGKAQYAKTVLFATGNGNKQRVNRGANLAQDLGVTLERGLFLIEKNGQTSIKGIFAAGDCVVYPVSLEQLVTAVSSAVQAVAGVYELLLQKRPPLLWGEAKIGRV